MRWKRKAQGNEFGRRLDAKGEPKMVPVPSALRE